MFLKTDWFCYPLFAVFLILKLTGVIAWSWWWVVSPLWIPWAILAVVFLLIGFGAFLAAALDI
jgi:hypothetical protein